MNLLKNPNFDEGHHHQDNIPEIVVPDHWHLYWIDNAVFPGASTIAYRPESVVWNIQTAPPHERALFFLSGDYCWKIFKANAPVYYAATQLVSGLTPGAVYRFNAKVYPDIVSGHSGGKKVRPGDIWAAEARAGWSAPDTPWPRAEDGDVNWSEWFNMHNQNFVYGAYNDVWVEFTAPAGGEVRVWVECKAKWGFENNWFMDSFSLEQVGGEPEPPPTPPVPPVKPPTPPIRPPTPPVEPPVPSERGAPREQYARTYILLPPTLSPEMAQVAFKVALAHRATIGFSADDAGIGDLDSRRVICVSPERIGTGLDQVWYDTYYPGVVFKPIAATSAADLEKKLEALF
ncbi:MAG: hypothetical protein ACP5J4_06210 [Anaerolineae bacterium]